MTITLEHKLGGTMLKEAPMTITLELPPEAEANLVVQAKARGLSLDAFLRTIITTQAAAMEAVKPVQSLTQEEEELDRAIDELFRRSSDSVRALRREIWYR